MMKKTPSVVLIALVIGLLLVTVHSQTRRSVKRPVEGDSSGLYYKDAQGVYTFVPRDCGFLGCGGPDQRSESQKFQRIALADPGSFRILIDSRESSGDILARDRTHVFYGGQYVPTADVNSLRVFGSYAKDDKQLYYRGVVFTGIDISTASIMGRDFISDRNGLYIANAVPPRKADLIDVPTFELLSQIRRADNRDYFAQDKNFYYYSGGGGYLVDPKPEAREFKKLGCGYYSFYNQIYFSVYRIAVADSASFRVVAPFRTYGNDIENCDGSYAIDKNHRYEFELPIRAYDVDRNKQVDLLLATPEKRKGMSEKFVTFCIPDERPGINSGFSRVMSESTMAGAFRVVQYIDARIRDAEVMNADGQRQQLPSMMGFTLDGCDSIAKERFYDLNKKSWFSRRDPTSISLRLGSDEDGVFVVCDRSFTVKLAFSVRQLVKSLQTALKDSQLMPYDANQPGWGPGWILENKFFVNIDGHPEIWIPLRIKNGGPTFREGIDFVTIGFTYREGQFQCVDSKQCASWAVPPAFKVDLSRG